MKPFLGVVLVVLASGLLCCVNVVRASPSEETRACVAASTQGQTDRDEGHWLAAREQLRACSNEVCPAIVRSSCREWLAQLEQRMPSVLVRVHETGQQGELEASLTIDGVRFELTEEPIPLDPGTHLLAVLAPGWLPVQRSFLLASGEQARVLDVQLPRRTEAGAPALLPDREPASAPEGVPPPPATGAAAAAGPAQFSVPGAAWVLGGVGVAGLVGFAILESKVKSQLHELQHECAPSCSTAQRDSGQRKVLLADVLLGVGIAGLVSASAWTLGRWLRRERAPAHASLSLLPVHGGLFGSLRAHY